MNNLTNLEKKVLSINTLYQYAEKCIEYEMNHFKQFIGKDIFKVDGSVKAKYAHEKISFDGKMDDGTFYHVHYWFELNFNYFDLHIKSCINGGSYDVKPSTAFCIYEETTYTMFNVKKSEPDELGYTKQLLAENTERFNNDYSIRYNADTVIEQANEVEKLAETYRNEYDKIPYYFRDVLHVKRLS